MSSIMASPVRILIVDDSPIVRLGLRSALEDHPEITIVAETGTAADAINAIRAHKPALVLLDLHLPDQSGLQACAEIMKIAPHTKVLILTSSADERNVQRAIAAGAQGYLLKENEASALAAAILHVAAGRSVLDPSLTDQVVKLVKNRPGMSGVERMKTLSYQEERVVALLAQGLTNKEIGDRLNLTEKTVKNYLATIFDKLGISRRSQAAALYVEANASKPA
jgi:two-component system response regulator DevR